MHSELYAYEYGGSLVARWSSVEPGVHLSRVQALARARARDDNFRLGELEVGLVAPRISGGCHEFLPGCFHTACQLRRRRGAPCVSDFLCVLVARFDVHKG